MGNLQEQPNANRDRTMRGIVARGRSVDVSDPTEKRTVGYSGEGKVVTRPAYRTYLPGQEVELPVKEILSLRERGFLVDPDQTVPPLAEGPHFAETGAHATAT